MYSTSTIKNKERVIEELVRFTRKVLSEPDICASAKNIAREHLGKDNATQLIADDLNDKTSLHIALERSEADDLFIHLLQEVVKDEQALY